MFAMNCERGNKKLIPIIHLPFRRGMLGPLPHLHGVSTNIFFKTCKCCGWILNFLLPNLCVSPSLFSFSTFFPLGPQSLELLENDEPSFCSTWKKYFSWHLLPSMTFCLDTDLDHKDSQPKTETLETMNQSKALYILIFYSNFSQGWQGDRVKKPL